MSTRQVASLLAAAAPEVLPPRDTLRAAAPDRYTLKVSIDQECEQGLRLLKDLMSHVDPRMSWGDLVARLVRDAVARHDPRGGGSGQRRRRSAGSAGVSPRRAPKETRAAGAPAAPARRTGGAISASLGAQAALLRRHRATPPLPKGRTRSGCWPTLLHRVSQGPPRLWMAPVQVAFHRARTPLLRRRSSRPAPWRMAPMPAPPCRARQALLRRRSGHSAGPLTADRAARQPEQRAAPRRLAFLRGQACRARRSPLRRRSRYSACSPTADRPTHQPEQRRTRPANLFTAATNPRRGATFPRRSGATSGNATVDAAVIAIRSPGGAAPRPICCRSTTCCQSPRAVARSRPTSISCAQLITECATATDRLLRRSPRCCAASALPARHSTRWPTACKWPGGDTLRSPASSACIFATASSDPGRSLSMRSRNGVVVVSRQRPLPAFVPPQPPAARGALNSRCNSDSRSGSRIATGLAAHDVPVAGRELHATRGGSEGAKGGGHRAGVEGCLAEWGGRAPARAAAGALS